VIDLIEGDLGCLVEDARERPIARQSVEEMLLNREVLRWLRGGPVPGPGAVALLEDNVMVFYRAPTEDEQANGEALRAALDELLRAQAATGARSCARDPEVPELTERERIRFGRRLDGLRTGRNLTIGELSARSGIDVLSIVALIHGAEGAGASEMMRLAAALDAPPRDLFPGFPARPEDEEDDGPGSAAGDEGGDA
jgi:hypothetical protein